MAPNRRQSTALVQQQCRCPISDAHVKISFSSARAFGSSPLAPAGPLRAWVRVSIPSHVSRRRTSKSLAKRAIIS